MCSHEEEIKCKFAADRDRVLIEEKMKIEMAGILQYLIIGKMGISIE